MANSANSYDIVSNELKKGSGAFPEEIWEIQHISYRCILPLIIVIGLAVSALSIVVLSRTSLRTTHVNTYFLLLASSDLLIFVISIATVITVNGCKLYSYNFTLYFAHVFFTLFYIVQTFSLYTILWISYDRFLAIWDFSRFNAIQKPSVMRMRIVFTLILCVLMHLKHLFEVEIVCSSAYGTGNSTDDCQSPGKDGLPLTDRTICENSGTHNSKYTCEHGTWVINDGLHFLYRKEMWRQIFWVFRGLIVSALPIMLVMVFNSGIVGGILYRRLQGTSSTPRTQRRDMSRLYIILAISATFISCTIPTLVHATFYAENIDNCHGPYCEEIFRAVANMLLLVEHITHFVILCFNESFWHELKRVISAIYQYMKDSLQTSVQRITCPSKPERNGSKPSEDSSQPRSPPPIVVPEITFEMESREQPQSPPDSNQVPLQFTTFNNSSSQPETTTSDALEPPRRSPTVSMVTLEEDL